MDDTAIAAHLQATTSLVALLKATYGDETSPSLREQRNHQAHSFSYLDFVEAVEQCKEEEEATPCRLYTNFQYAQRIFDV